VAAAGHPLAYLAQSGCYILGLVHPFWTLVWIRGLSLNLGVEPCGQAFICWYNPQQNIREASFAEDREPMRPLSFI
jgi:hypothetical protein